MRPTALILALATPLLLWGCGGPEPTLEDEVAQFAALTNVKPLVQACQELDKLCKSSGKGCKAHSLLCTGKGPGGLFGDAGMPALPNPPKVPSPGQIKNKVKQMICNNLKQVCAKLPLACKIYNKHCGQGGAADAGPAFPKPGMPNFKLPKLPKLPKPPLPGKPDFQLPKPPGFDKAKCCAALDTCIKQNDAACAAAKSACAPQVQLPPMPGMPGNGKMQISMLEAAHKALCSSP